MSDCNELNNETFFRELVPLINDLFCVRPISKPPRILPILGPGLLENLNGSLESIFSEWYDKYPLPVYTPSCYGDLPQLAEHQAAIGSPNSVFRYFSERIILHELKDISEHYRDLYTILANLKCPIYVTTNIDTLLEEALAEKERSPYIVCHPWQGTQKTKVKQGSARPGTWNYHKNGIDVLRERIKHKKPEENQLEFLEKMDAIDTYESRLEKHCSDESTYGSSSDQTDKNQILSHLNDISVQYLNTKFIELCKETLDKVPEPTCDRPLVYKILGKIEDEDEESIATLERHYFEYLMNLGQENLESKVVDGLKKSVLLFLGFRLEDWTFRAVFQSLMKACKEENKKPNFIVHPCPEKEEKRNAMSTYLERYFASLRGNTFVYWGDLPEFSTKLKQQLPGLSQ